MKKTLEQIGDAVVELLDTHAEDIQQAMTFADEEEPSVSVSIGIKIDPAEWRVKMSFVKERLTCKASGLVGQASLPFDAVSEPIVREVREGE